jgi:hypothetical protein
MNPFGDLSSSHSTWWVILTIYNLPPWPCQKCRYLLLTYIISGPKQSGNDIDVFLKPLMEDMKIRWEDGVKMMDASLKKEFTLKAIIFVTITDYPSLFSLSGQIKGKSGCVVCIDGTCYTYLNASKKFETKKKEEDGTTTRKKRKQNKMEEEQPPVTPIPFKK